MSQWKSILLSAVLAIATNAFADDPEPELGGNCAMSAAVGVSRPTSCSVVWISPEDKLYCFSNESAKQAFMRDAGGNEKKAQAFFKDPDLWKKLKLQSPEG